ncbi:glycoside hydrolase family 3 N-terminal domain-containing protein [Kutzneria sp. CA-103260]|uniref:glycoside hydrolase family 3 N-terminal domain-containing protein n=1 Tax=Kutzneria sp. CA-103260 TaxID=2802641 RepID=UPI001BEDA4B0|nr:glycoside hydrolase family 3 N-terminal domain-containing protein [Kutzneria sp. CA-103260]QUQ72241.1 sugar hydrolase [Kutzneria sp. CA-103260]
MGSISDVVRWAVVVTMAGPLALVGTPAPLATNSTLPTGLSTDQLAGQRVIYSYPGATPPQSLLDRISQGRAGGVIFFGENIQSAAQIKGAVDQLRQAASKSPVHQPLLLMTDQEGGLVRRLPGAPTMSEKQIGQAANAQQQAANAGTGAGQNLASVDMNFNLAPVLDVYRTPGDFDDSAQRSYSTDPAKVNTLGAAFVSAQQQTGVAATVKHFPGLGSATTQQNTDEQPVTLTASADTLRNVDEAAYPASVAAGAKSVMLSWAIYSSLDPKLPAGLSPTIINQELRGRLGFKGVTITDALEAGALKAFGDTGQRAVSAAGAGMDLILCSGRDVSQGDQAAAAISAAVTNNQLDHSAFDASVERVLDMRGTLR